MNFGDGTANVYSVMDEDLQVSHTYFLPGEYNASVDIECSCNALFSSSASQQVIAQVCNDATRSAYHAAAFVKNPYLDINNTVALVHGTIKVKSTGGGDFGDFVNAVQTHWNKTFATGVIDFQFTQVGVTYFGTDALIVDMDSVLPGSIEQGHAAQGGRELLYASTASTGDIAHEFGHILGFDNAYIVLPSGHGQDLPCHVGISWRLQAAARL